MAFIGFKGRVDDEYVDAAFVRREDATVMRHFRCVAGFVGELISRLQTESELFVPKLTRQHPVEFVRIRDVVSCNEGKKLGRVAGWMRIAMYAIPAIVSDQRVAPGKLSIESRCSQVEAFAENVRCAFATEKIEELVCRDVIRAFDGAFAEFADAGTVAGHQGRCGIVRRHIACANLGQVVKGEDSLARLSERRGHEWDLEHARGVDWRLASDGKRGLRRAVEVS